MTRVDAQIRLSAYLKSHLIYFAKDFYDGIPRFTESIKSCHISFAVMKNWFTTGNALCR